MPPDPTSFSQPEFNTVVADFLLWLDSNEGDATLALAPEQSMNYDEESAIAQLQADDPKVRIEYLNLFRDCWQPSNETISKCLEVARFDSMALVRGAAVSALIKHQFAAKQYDFPVASELEQFLGELAESEICSADEDEDDWDDDLTLDCERALNKHEDYWKELGGPLYDGMIASIDTTISSLQHPSRNVRLAALHVLRSHWHTPKKYAAQVEHVVFHDPEHDVRNLAILVLAACFMGRNDLKAGGILANIVRDKSQAEDFRKSAYRGLHLLRGTLDSSVVIASVTEGRFDVDWDFVASFPRQ